MDSSAASGHLEIVTWLHSYRQEGCTMKAMDDNCRKWKKEIVEWLHRNFPLSCSTYAMYNAVFPGNIQILQFSALRAF
ncbi:hypothetical protein GQ600_10526 [Phytophthora cactorum]|nr:hypothetical protein GQ600_10526 [Phytophthora cactorum]